MTLLSDRPTGRSFREGLPGFAELDTGDAAVPGALGRRRSVWSARLVPIAVVAQLDGVAVGIVDVQRGRLALCAPAPRRTVHHVEPTACLQRVEVDGFDDDAEVVRVLTRARRSNEIDDRPLVDARRREWRVASSPFVDARGLQPELVAVERE